MQDYLSSNRLKTTKMPPNLSFLRFFCHRTTENTEFSIIFLCELFVFVAKLETAKFIVLYLSSIIQGIS